MSEVPQARTEILEAWEKHLENHPCGPCYEYLDDMRQAISDGERASAAENERLRDLLHRVQRRAREELGIDV